MLMLAFFRWWYASGWISALKAVEKSAVDITQMYSLPILVRTLFAPWKQIITNVGNQAGIGPRLRAVLDNIISRFVGFWVRTFVIIAGVLSLIVVVLVRLLIVIVWPLLPFGPLIAIGLSL